jgi:hypothetical protein
VRKGSMLVAGVVAGVATLPAVPAGAAPPLGEPCVYHEMSTVEGGNNIITAADPSGRYQIGVRGYWDENGVVRAHLIVWRDGVPRLGPELPATGTEFVAVGPTGVAVGFRDSDDGRGAVAYTYGRIVALPAPAAGAETTATAVNAAGQIAGTLLDDGLDRQPVVWSPDGDVRVLPTPAGFEWSTAWSLDTDGTVFGYAASGNYSMPDRIRLVVWPPDGVPRVLPPSEAGSDPLMWPIDIQGGVVYGVEDGEVVRWDPGASVPTAVDTGGASEVSAVNARGSILAWGANGRVLIQDGTARPLDGDGLWITPVGLADNDVVYGRSNQGGWPAYVDCG